ncbi:MAG TPA: hypothetical protein VFA33_07600 [Bryobacteraceae bacterium]|nr:hypothetical protein [Bryobacteraceae bacterium]
MPVELDASSIELDPRAIAPAPLARTVELEPNSIELEPSAIAPEAPVTRTTGPQPGSYTPPPAGRAPIPAGLQGPPEPGRRGVYHGEPIEETPPSHPGEMREALGFGGSYAKLIPPADQDASVPAQITRGALRGIVNTLSPESASYALAFLVGGEALPAAANLAPVARALKDLPSVLKALDVTAHAAVPAAGLVVGGKNLAQGGVPRNMEQAAETAINALLLGASAVGAIRAGHEVLKAYPEGPTPEAQTRATQTGGIATPPVSNEQAAATAEALAQQGRRLAAQAWKDLDRSQPLPIQIGNQTVYLQPPAKVPRVVGEVQNPDTPWNPPTRVTKGSRVVHTITESADPTSKALVSGTPEVVQNWLQSRQATVSRTPYSGPGDVGGAPPVVPAAEVSTLTQNHALPSDIQPGPNGTVVIERPSGKYTIHAIQQGQVSFVAETPAGNVRGTLPLPIFRQMIEAPPAAPAPAATANAPAPAAAGGAVELDPATVQPAPAATQQKPEPQRQTPAQVQAGVLAALRADLAKAEAAGNQQVAADKRAAIARIEASIARSQQAPAAGVANGQPESAPAAPGQPTPPPAVAAPPAAPLAQPAGDLGSESQAEPDLFGQAGLSVDDIVAGLEEAGLAPAQKSTPAGLPHEPPTAAQAGGKVWPGREIPLSQDAEGKSRYWVLSERGSVIVATDYERGQRGVIPIQEREWDSPEAFQRETGYQWSPLESLDVRHPIVRAVANLVHATDETGGIHWNGAREDHEAALHWLESLQRNYDASGNLAQAVDATQSQYPEHPEFATAARQALPPGTSEAAAAPSRDARLAAVIRSLAGRTQSASLPAKVEKEFDAADLEELKRRGYILQQGNNGAYATTVQGRDWAEAMARPESAQAPIRSEADQETGPHGPIFRQFSAKPAEAIAHLLAARTGEVPRVWHHPELGWIDLIWGDERGGLAHIVSKHAEGQKDLHLEDLADLIPRMRVVKNDGRTARLESETHEAGVRLDYDGVKKRWLVTAYEKPSTEGSPLVPGAPQITPRGGGHPPSGGSNSSVTPAAEAVKSGETQQGGLQWADTQGIEDIQKEHGTPENYYDATRAHQKREKAYLDGHLDRLQATHGKRGAAELRRQESSRHHASQAAYEHNYTEVELTLGKAAAERMRAEVEKHAPQRLPLRENFRYFWHTLRNGDKIEGTAGTVEVVKTDGFHMQPILPTGGAGGRWAAFGSGAREVSQVEVRFPNGKLHSFRQEDFEKYLYDDTLAAEGEPEEKPTTQVSAPAAAEGQKLLAITGQTFKYKALLRAIPGATWNAEEKAWIIPDTEANRAQVQRISRELSWRAFTPQPEAQLPAAPADLRWTDAAMAEAEEAGSLTGPTTTPENYYVSMRTEQKRKKEFIDGYNARLRGASRAGRGAPFVRKKIVANQRDAEREYAQNYSEVERRLGKPAADRMRAEVERGPQALQPPAVGQLVKLTSTEDYHTYNLKTVWNWLRVIRADQNTVTVRETHLPTDPAQDFGPEVEIPLSQIGQRDETPKPAEKPAAPSRPELDQQTRREVYETAIDNLRADSKDVRGLIANQGGRAWVLKDDASVKRLRAAVASAAEILEKVAPPESSNARNALESALADGRILLAEVEHARPEPFAEGEPDLFGDAGLSVDDIVAGLEEAGLAPPQKEPTLEDKVNEAKGTTPLFREGERVTWQDRNGKTLTGTVRGNVYADIDDYADVDTDQILHAGGVPIGRIEHVPLPRLQRIETPAKSAPEPAKPTKVPTATQKAQAEAQPLSDTERAVLEHTAAGHGSQGFDLLTSLTEGGLAEDAANRTIYQLVRRGLIQRINDPEADGDRFVRTPAGTAALRSTAPPPAAESAQPKPEKHANPLEQAAADAAARLRAKYLKNTTLNAGIDPADLRDLTVIGAKYILDGAIQFEAWSKQVMAALGDLVRAIAETSKLTTDAVLRQVYQYAAGAAKRYGVAAEPAPAPAKPTTIEAEGTHATSTGSGGQAGSRTERPSTETAGGVAGEPPVTLPHPGAEGQAVRPPVGANGAHAAPNPAAPARPAETELRPGGGDRPTRGAATPVTGLEGDYRLTPEQAAEIESRGAKTKVRNNLEAIRTVKQIIQEGGRPATLEEQQKIAGFVGWGASEISQGVFTGYKSDWAGIREDVENALTDAEYEAARTSTENAHYTRRDLARAMWDLAVRLGFRAGGSVLEPGMGIGNFFMMMPEELIPGTSRTGVEMDLLSGAMARALFPGSQILVKPYQKTNLPDGYFDLVIGNVPFAGHGVVDPVFKRWPFLTENVHNYFFAKSMEKLRPGGVMIAITSRYSMDGKGQAFRKWMAERAELLGAVRLPRDTFQGNAGTGVTTDILILRKRIPGGIPISNEAWAESREMETKDGFKVDVNEYFHRHPEMMMGEMQGGTQYRRGYPELFGEFSLEGLQERFERLPEDVMPSWNPQQIGAPGELAENYPEASYLKNGQYGYVNGALVQKDGAYLRPVPVKPNSVKAKRMKGLIELRGAAREVIRSQHLDLSEEEILEARQNLNKVYEGFVKQHGPVNVLGNALTFGEDPDWPVLTGLLEDYDKKAMAAARQALEGRQGQYLVTPQGDVVLTDGKPKGQRWTVARKRPVFRERTIQKPARITHVETGAEALAVSLNDYGHMDWDRMQELTGREPEDLQQELAGKIFRNPISKQWETADEYLSGNVRQKLADAEFAAREHPEYAGNVEALKAVQPPWKEPGKIRANLGATWIPDSDYTQFAREVLKVESDSNEPLVRLVSLTGGYGVRPTFTFLDNGVANTTEFGTPYFSGMDLFELSLNGRTPVARDYYEDANGAERSVKNPDATIEANEKQRLLNDKFAAWLWSDPERAQRLAEKFNWERNNLRLREYDGSHLTFPGLNTSWLRAGKPDPHQVNAVWRTIQSGNTLYAHVVGAGKTLEAIMAAMELRRLGLAKKPMVVVPNHLVGQWRDDWMRAYPAAQILVPTKKDFEKQNRQKLMSRIASGNYDAVIVGHASFEKLPVKDETFEEFINHELADINAALEAARRGKSAQDERRDPTVKQLVRRRAQLEARLEKRTHREDKDTGLSFEELGVDQLFVDEADLFKNLGYLTMMDRVAGLPNTDSNRATDMLLKTQYVMNLHGGDRGVVFMTGTPVSNSIAEVWTMMRYLMPRYLEREGLNQFDAWAKTFGQTRTQMEVAPEGGRFIQRTRFNKFQNASQMMNMFRVVADIRTAQQLNLPTPAIWKGGYVDVISPASDLLKQYIELIGERADAVRAGEVEPDEDNMLKISSDGRKASLDLRLVLGQSAGEDPQSKVNKCAANVVEIYKEFAEHKATQLIFLDLSTPKSEKVRRKKSKPSGQVANPETANLPMRRELPGNAAEEETAEANLYGEKEEPEEEEAETTEEARERFHIYGELRKKLIAGGIPPEQIAFIQDAKTDDQKSDLFAAMRRGDVRVLMGSTEKMGAGMNVQDRLVALHHLDSPWRPRDMQQRDGRAVRQGNELWDAHHIPVRLYRYMTEGSFDAFMWETLAAKAAPIEQLMSGDPSIDEVDELSPLVLSYEQAKAASAGNPLVREKIILDQDIHKLEVMRGAWLSEQSNIAQQLAQLPGEIQGTRQHLQQYDQDIATRDAHPEMVVEGVTYEGKEIRAKGAEALMHLLQGLGPIAQRTPLQASYRGFALLATPETEFLEARVETEKRGGRLYVRERTPDSKYFYWLVTTPDIKASRSYMRADLGLKALDQQDAEAVHAAWDKVRKSEGHWEQSGQVQVYTRPGLALKADSNTYLISTNYSNPVGTIQSLEHQVSFEDSTRFSRDHLRRLEKSQAELESKAGQAFPREEELQKMLRRQAELAQQLGETEDDRQALAAAEEGDARNPLAPYLKDPNASLRAKWFPSKKFFGTGMHGRKYVIKARAVSKFLAVQEEKGNARQHEQPQYHVVHMPSGRQVRGNFAQDYQAVAYARQASKALPWDWAKPPEGFSEQLEQFNASFVPPTETPEDYKKRIDAARQAPAEATPEEALELRRQEQDLGADVGALAAALDSIEDRGTEDAEIERAHDTLERFGLQVAETSEAELRQGARKLLDQKIAERQKIRRQLGGLFVEQPGGLDEYERAILRHTSHQPQTAEELEQAVAEDVDAYAKSRMATALTRLLQAGYVREKGGAWTRTEEGTLAYRRYGHERGSLSLRPRVTAAQIARQLEPVVLESPADVLRKMGGPAYWVEPGGKLLEVEAPGRETIDTHNQAAQRILGQRPGGTANELMRARDTLLAQGYIRLRGVNVMAEPQAYGNLGFQTAVQQAANYARYTGAGVIVLEAGRSRRAVPLADVPELLADPAKYLRRAAQRGSAPMLIDLADWIARQFETTGPQVNYSGLGALSDRYLRNLSQLQKASAAAHTAAVRAASSRAQAATILRAAVPAILKELHGGNFTWPELRLALIESRLRGLRERWQNFAEQVDQIPDNGLRTALNEQFLELLAAIEGKRGMPEDVAQTAVALAAAEDWDTLRAFLAQTFRDAAANVQTVMPAAWYDAVTADAHVQRALATYQRLVERPMAENHALNEGVFSDALGPLHTYYPLIPTEKPQHAPGPGRRLPYRTPKNAANKFATGLAEGYDATMQALRDRLTGAVRANDKAALLRALEEEGLLESAGREQRTFVYQGVEYEGERVEISPERLILTNGKHVHVPARMGIMPRWLHRELRPILEGQRLDTPTVIDRILRKLNTFALAGPADFVFHTSNLLGTLVANTPFLENSPTGKVLSLPLAKKFYAVGKVLATDPTTRQSAEDLVEMAKLGLVPDRYGSVTLSQRAAEELGAEQQAWNLPVGGGRTIPIPKGFGAALYGPKGIDVRARLVMYRLAKSLNPDATPQELFDFVNQLGNYVPALQGEIERALKSSGFAPFFTAGSTMIRNGIHAWAGNGPMPKSGAGLRLWQQLTGGALGLLALWAVVYKEYTGKWPWKDKRAKLLQIPANERDRRSALGKALWGQGSETGYLNFGFFNPLVLRGGRALGLPGAMETYALGGSPGQAAEAAQRDVINAFAHPALGPPARGAFVLATGQETYLTGLRDRQGRVGLQFFPAIPPRTKPGLPAIGERMRAAGRELNAFYGAVGSATGLLGEEAFNRKGNAYLRMVLDLSLPGLVGNASNPYKRAEMLRQQRTGTR